MDRTHHYSDYVELGAPDLPAATAFYAAAFGWRFTDDGDAYAGIRAPDGDGEVGGLDAGGPAGPGGALVLVRSDDLDVSVTAVTGAGGEVVEGPYDYPGGRRFSFRDPNGNVLGVYQPAEPEA
jgi:predicted enzyme related to lactoylglutathione lyase